MRENGNVEWRLTCSRHAIVYGIGGEMQGFPSMQTGTDVCTLLGTWVKENLTFETLLYTNLIMPSSGHFCTIWQIQELMTLCIP